MSQTRAGHPGLSTGLLYLQGAITFDVSHIVALFDCSRSVVVLLMKTCVPSRVKLMGSAGSPLMLLPSPQRKTRPLSELFYL